MFQRQVGDVAGDHEVIRLPGSVRKHGKQVLATMYAASVQNEVRVTRQPLVEDDATPFGGRPRKDVQVGDVRDANHTNQRLCTCRHLLDAARQRVAGTVCRALPPHGRRRRVQGASTSYPQWSIVSSHACWSWSDRSR